MVLIQILLKIDVPSLKHPYTSKAHFSFTSYSKLIRILVESSLVFQSMFLIQFLLEIDDNPLWSIPHPRKQYSYTILIRNWLSFFLEYPSSSKACVLFSFWFECDKKSSLKHPSASKTCFLVKSCSKFMEILSETSLLVQSIFLIQFLIKIDEHYFWSIPPLSMHVSCSILILFSSLKYPSASKAFFWFESHSDSMNILSGIQFL